MYATKTLQHGPSRRSTCVIKPIQPSTKNKTRTHNANNQYRNHELGYSFIGPQVPPLFCRTPPRSVAPALGAASACHCGRLLRRTAACITRALRRFVLYEGRFVCFSKETAQDWNGAEETRAEYGREHPRTAECDHKANYGYPLRWLGSRRSKGFGHPQDINKVIPHDTVVHDKHIIDNSPYAESTTSHELDESKPPIAVPDEDPVQAEHAQSKQFDNEKNNFVILQVLPYAVSDLSGIFRGRLRKETSGLIKALS